MLEEYPLKKTDVPDFVMPEFKRELFFKKAGENDRIKTRVRGKDGFQVGKEALDLRYVEADCGCGADGSTGCPCSGTRWSI